MKKIFLIPVFNEEQYLQSFIDDVKKYAHSDDIFIYIDDRSTDNSIEILNNNKRKCDLILKNEKNTGLGSVLKKGFNYISSMEPDDNTIIITLDSDNQHDFSNIDHYIKHFKENDIDAMFLARKMILYPVYKKIGNKLLSFWTSLLLGKKIVDVETGFRIFNYKSIKNILKYYKGYRYSCAQELMIISGMLNLKMENNIFCDIKHYRSNTTIIDFIVNAFVAFRTFIYLKLKGV